jgi:hypothetical protein
MEHQSKLSGFLPKKGGESIKDIFYIVIRAAVISDCLGRDVFTPGVFYVRLSSYLLLKLRKFKLVPLQLCIYILVSFKHAGGIYDGRIAP